MPQAVYNSAQPYDLADVSYDGDCLELLYDSASAYDDSFRTYDGNCLFYFTLPIKEALYRELRYGTVLAGLIDPSRIKLDMRNIPPALRGPADYPWLIFRRITSTENNQVAFARERIELQLIARRQDGDLLEALQSAILKEFAGQTKTWGKFDLDGSPNPNAGLRLRGMHLSTVDLFAQGLAEESMILIFVFSYVRS